VYEKYINSNAGTTILAIPLFIDQFLNALRAQRLTGARVVDKALLTSEHLANEILLAVNDEK
jgi:UDP:flavonoid glycosyltransferase YjiC (YdhE family)